MTFGVNSHRQPSRANQPRRHTGIVSTLLALAPIALGAQRVRPSLEIGATSMRYADSIAASGASITPSLMLDWPWARARGTGTYTQLVGTGWSTQGMADISLFTPSRALTSGELTASSSGSAHWDGTRTGQAVAIARVHVDAPVAGLWVGGGIGNGWDGLTDHGLMLGDLGAWMSRGSSALLIASEPTRLGGTVRYVDMEMSAQWKSALVDLLLSGGYRSGDRLPTVGSATRSWRGASIVAHVTPRVGILLGAGTYPIDLAQGFPGGRYLMLNLRFTAAPPPRGDAFEQQHLLEAPSESIAFTVSPSPNGSERTIRVRAPDARSVEISGDFSSWQPMSLAATGGGWWSATILLRPGTYQIALRVDGGTWVTPPGLLPIADEFGGSVGLLVVN